MAQNRGLKNDILRLRKRGLSYKQISDKLKCSKGTVQYHCTLNNLTDIGMNNHPVSRTVALAIYNHQKTHTNKQGCVKFGLSRGTIKKYGIFENIPLS